MSHHVLVVDGERQGLSALKRLLRGKVDWELTFTESAELALIELVAHPVDVVVTGLHLPGMAGGDLLTHVRRFYPRTGRLLMSDDDGGAEALSALGAAQAVVTRPRDVATLVGAVEQTLAVRDRNTDDRLRAILGDVDALPAPPSVHLQLVNVTSRPTSGIADVVEVLESDLALCADILRLVNSAYFGLAHRVDSIARAVSLLGLDTVHVLALSGKVFGVDLNTPENLDVAALRRTAMGAAGYARVIAAAERWRPESVGRAFLATMLRDVGLLVLAADAEAYSQVRKVPAEDAWARSMAELDAFGCTVAEASAYILGQWGLAEPVVDAIACQPTRTDDNGATPMAHVVSFAHLRTLGNHVPAQAGTTPWHEARTRRWNDVCDTCVPLAL